ncbi:MAG TPA: lysylphosphatidylglycerol synthase transmembrane domain-containing protein, partial [Anaerolineae bacterium]
GTTGDEGPPITGEPSLKRRWLYYLLIIVFLAIVVSRFTEATKLVRTLAAGQPQWIAVAFLVQAVYYVVFPYMFQSALWTVEIPGRLWDLIPVWFTSVFLNITAPSAGMTGAAVFVDDAARRGYSHARAAAAMVLVLVADYSAFAVLLVAGMAYLFVTKNLHFYEVLAAAILMLFILTLSFVLVLGVWRPAALHRLLVWVHGRLDALARLLKRPPFVAADWGEKNAIEFTQAAAAIQAHPLRLARTFAAAMAAHLLEMTTLYTLTRAFNAQVHPGVLVAGYAVGILFWVVAVTPSGIGVVEGIMALVFTTLGVAGEAATLISLAFRGMTFWLPLLIGFLLLRRTRSFGGGRAAAEKRG